MERNDSLLKTGIMKEILPLFIEAVKGNFPVGECTVPCEAEDGVFESPNWYICLLTQIGWPGSYTLLEMRPYICKENDQVVGYSWVTRNRNEFYDNMEFGCHGDDMVVVGFKKIVIDAPLERYDDLRSEEEEALQNKLKNFQSDFFDEEEE